MERRVRGIKMKTTTVMTTAKAAKEAKILNLFKRNKNLQT